MCEGSAWYEFYCGAPAVAFLTVVTSDTHCAWWSTEALVSVKVPFWYCVAVVTCKVAVEVEVVCECWDRCVAGLVNTWPYVVAAMSIESLCSTVPHM